MAQRFQKSPTSARVFTVDLQDVLPAGVTIASVAWNIPSGLTNAGTSNTNSAALIKLSGGTLGTEYAVTCTTTWSDGQIDVRTIFLTMVRT